MISKYIWKIYNFHLSHLAGSHTYIQKLYTKHETFTQYFVDITEK